MKRLLALLAALLAAFGISGITAASEEIGSTFFLTGRTIFSGYFPTSGFVFSPADYNFCDATGTLTRMEKKTYALELLECAGFGFPRLSIWELKIVAPGVVKTDAEEADWVFPAFDTGTLIGDVELHTGCSINGTYPVYHGTWDGHTLYAAGHFHSRCENGTFWGDPNFWIGVDDPEGHLDDGVTWDDGPAHVSFAIELFVEE